MSPCPARTFSHEDRVAARVLAQGASGQAGASNVVKLETIGACREVGRSAFKLTNDDGDQVVLDYGISMRDDGKNNFPGDVEPRKVRAVICSHAHIDHSGALPYFYISARPNCYMTATTRMLVKYLMEDMLHISGDNLPFEDVELKSLLKYIQVVNDYKAPVKVPGTEGCHFAFHDAGHIPGSVMTVVSMDGKNVLYTGDMNTIDTRIQWAAKLARLPPIDAVIIESTYAKTVHPPRLETEQSFVEAIKEVLDGGGQVLVPAFGVARSQEILSILQVHGLQRWKIVIDGMARSISTDLLKHQGDLRSVYSLDKVTMVKTNRARSDRMRAMEEGDIVIAPSGMLKGGTARYYAENFIENPKNAVFLVSFQVPGTPGRVLLEEKRYELDPDEEEYQLRAPPGAEKGAKVEIPVKARVEHFPFSSHSDGPALLAFLKSLPYNKDGSEPKVFCVHGDAEN
ncbi:MAG: MBL fold metallo-hydrolase, partial [Candidatus Lokiarchaeota archaeon]|nr:MBL fold metallo-hydrolase [Candidatus Lokiarchaeota archaeon]